MTIVPGASFGRFCILHRLGAGAMGEVWLAEDPQIERRVAIKTVRMGRGGEPPGVDLLARLVQEAKAAGRLVHPHVVTLFDAGEIEDVFFLAFEYVAGSDLATRMRRKPPLTVQEILAIGREAAAGLGAAHRRGIVHRDVKPSNLLLTEEGAVKISDFGIAKLAGPGADLTQSGFMIGTPQYLSPEQVRGEALDGRSDLFSLGVVLYELLTAQKPFAGDTLTSLIYDIVNRDPAPISLGPDLAPRLAAAVMRLLSKDREARFPSAEVLAEELSAAEQELAALRRDAIAEIRPTDATGRPERAQEDVATVRLPGRASVEATAGAPSERSRGLPALASMRVRLLLGVPVAAVAAIMILQGAAGEEDGRVGQPQSPGVVDPAEPVETLDRESGGAPPEEGRGARGSDGKADLAAEPDTPVARESGESSPLQRVAGIVTFSITPPEASRAAVVRVDGLVRGPARSSLLTLQPGEHRIEVLADGFAPAVLLVDSRPQAGESSRLEVTMTPE